VASTKAGHTGKQQQKRTTKKFTNLWLKGRILIATVTFDMPAERRHKPHAYVVAIR